MKKRINLIFIDIEGVLNSRHFNRMATYYTWDLFDPRSVKLLNRLIEEFDGKLVLTSNWTKRYELTKIREIFKKNKIEGSLIGSVINDSTKESAIKTYIDSLSSKLKNVNYIIVDNDSNLDQSDLINKIVKTNPEWGFTVIEYKKSI